MRSFLPITLAKRENVDNSKYGWRGGLPDISRRVNWLISLCKRHFSFENENLKTRKIHDQDVCEFMDCTEDKRKKKKNQTQFKSLLLGD